MRNICIQTSPYQQSENSISLKNENLKGNEKEDEKNKENIKSR
jgi:hypothetical protein